MEHNEIEAALRLRIYDLEREAGTWQLLAQTKMTEMIQQAALKAIANAEVERLQHQIKYWQVEAETDNARWLRCLEENERLRKAGDDLFEFAKTADTLAHKELKKVLKAWSAAKEGRPNE